MIPDPAYADDEHGERQASEAYPNLPIQLGRQEHNGDLCSGFGRGALHREHAKIRSLPTR